MLHIHACCKHMFKSFEVFHMYVCKCFIKMLHMFAMIFKCFSGVFGSVSNACFKYFICLFMLQLLHRCFKSRLGVAHGIRVRSGWWRGRCLGRRGTTTGVLPRKPDTLGALSLPVWAASGRLCPQRSGASKSVVKISYLRCETWVTKRRAFWRVHEFHVYSMAHDELIQQHGN
jgi:hypothetical protein